MCNLLSDCQLFNPVFAGNGLGRARAGDLTAGASGNAEGRRARVSVNGSLRAFCRNLRQPCTFPVA